MRALIQRVSEASVRVDAETIAHISSGLLILLGVEEGDSREELDWLVGKIARLRVFEDEEGRLNRSLLDTDGEALVVSQFTLHASTKKGNRPSFARAAAPSAAEQVYELFADELGSLLEKNIPRGRFGAHMEVSLINDGPVTIMIDSRLRE